MHDASGILVWFNDTHHFGVSILCEDLREHRLLDDSSLIPLTTVPSPTPLSR